MQPTTPDELAGTGTAPTPPSPHVSDVASVDAAPEPEDVAAAVVPVPEPPSQDPGPATPDLSLIHI